MLLVGLVHGHLAPYIWVGIMWHAVVEFCVISLLSSKYRAGNSDASCLSLLSLFFCLGAQTVWMLSLRYLLPLNSDLFYLFVFILFLFSFRDYYSETYGERKKAGLDKLVSTGMTFVNISGSGQVLCPAICSNAEYFPLLLIHLKCLVLLTKCLRDGPLLSHWDPG